MKTLGLMILVAGLSLATGGAYARCFDFIGEGPREVGPVKLAEPATRICNYQVHAFGGYTYYELKLSDANGTLAELASKDEADGRCLCYAKIYRLDSGNANGANVDPDHTNVTIWMENQSGPSTGNVIIYHPSTGKQTYPVRSAP